MFETSSTGGRSQHEDLVRREVGLSEPLGHPVDTVIDDHHNGQGQVERPYRGVDLVSDALAHLALSILVLRGPAKERGNADEGCDYPSGDGHGGHAREGSLGCVPVDKKVCCC